MIQLIDRVYIYCSVAKTYLDTFCAVGCSFSGRPRGVPEAATLQGQTELEVVFDNETEARRGLSSVRLA